MQATTFLSEVMVAVAAFEGKLQEKLHRSLLPHVSHPDGSGEEDKQENKETGLPVIRQGVAIEGEYQNSTTRVSAARARPERQRSRGIQSSG